MDILAIMGKREQKVQITVSNKIITDTTEYSVRLEPGTFAMRSESHTTRPKSHTKSKGVEKNHLIRTVNK